MIYQVYMLASLLVATLHCQPCFVQKRKEVSDLPKLTVTVWTLDNSTQGYVFDHFVASLAIVLDICRPFRHGVQQVERSHFRQACEDYSVLVWLTFLLPASWPDCHVRNSSTHSHRSQLSWSCCYNLPLEWWAGPSPTETTSQNKHFLSKVLSTSLWSAQQEK